MKHILVILLPLSVFIGCKNDDSPLEQQSIEVTDAQLFHMALNTPKAAFYKNSTDTIPGNSGTAHAGKIVVWYNAKAATQLDVQGKVKSNPVFADSSLIVKQIFNTSNNTTAYAFLFKLRSAVNAGAGGWIWSELDSSGQPLISAKARGEGCSGCHSAGSGVDYTRMNDAHP
jgi:hypothetical protein